MHFLRAIQYTVALSAALAFAANVDAITYGDDSTINTTNSSGSNGTVRTSPYKPTEPEDVLQTYELEQQNSGPIEEESESEEVEYSPENAQNLRDIIANDPNFKTLAKGLRDTDLLNLLKSPGPFTILAPNEAAFSKLSSDKRQDILNNKEKLKQILTYHIVPKKLTANQSAGKVRTVNGKDVDVKSTGGITTINNARVVHTDLIASNGVIFEIDTVLTP